jgi:hypothetical protein
MGSGCVHSFTVRYYLIYIANIRESESFQFLPLTFSTLELAQAMQYCGTEHETVFILSLSKDPNFKLRQFIFSVVLLS